MDYPKSVPGVGLVGGKFVDEDAAMGRQGSLVPSAWGNSVTDELLNVLRAAGVEPDEALQDQLSKVLIRDPTEALRGMPVVASQVEVDAGVDDAKVVTSKKLRRGFAFAFASGSGYLAFPSWLGGLIFQMVLDRAILTGGRASVDVTHPVPFVSAVYMRLAAPSNNSTTSSSDNSAVHVVPASSDLNKTRVLAPNASAGNTGFCVFLIGK